MSTSTYPLPDLLHKWAQGQLTAEQAIGHLIQHAQASEKRQAEVEQRLRQLEQVLAKFK